MNIAMFAWETLFSNAVGGQARHVTELAAALERRDHEVHVFCRSANGTLPHEIIDGVHYHRCPFDLHPDFITEMNNMGNSFVYFLAHSEAHQGRHFDIVHGHDWLCSKALVQAKNGHGRHIVLTLHSTEFGRCGNVSHDGHSGRVSAVEAEGAFCADRVITVSPALADEVKRLYAVPDRKLRMIHNGIHCERFDGYIDPAVCRRTYGIGPLDPMILFVGRLSVQKGPDLLLEAMPAVLARHERAKLVFAGDGDMMPALRRRAGELGVSHAVRFLGSMHPDGDLINLFKSTDVVCVPSRNEPFGIVVLEAWAAGKPVVSTRNGGPSGFVSHDRDGYLVYDNPPSVSWGLNQVFENFEHARWMGSQGRIKAAFGFTWDTVAEQTEGVYGELL